MSSRIKPVYLLLAGVALVYAAAVTPNWRLHPDSAVYIALAESILRGKGYWFNGAAHLRYPPVFSLMLAPFVWCFGRDFLAMRVFGVMLATGNTYLAYRLWRAYAGQRIALILAALGGFSVFVIEHTTLVLAELPLTFFSLLALLAGRRLLGESQRWMRWALLTGVVLVAAFMTKLVGLTLVLGFCAGALNNFFREKDFRQLLKLTVVVLICLLPLSWWIFRVRSGLRQGVDAPRYERHSPTYWDDFVRPELYRAEPRPLGTEKLLGRLSHNGRFITEDVGNLVFNLHSDLGRFAGGLPEALPILLLPATMLLVGVLLRIRSNPGPMEFYLVAYLLVLLVYGGYEKIHAVRFVVPLIPPVFFYVWCSFSALKRVIISLASGKVLSIILTTVLTAYFSWLGIRVAQETVLQPEHRQVVLWVLPMGAILTATLFALIGKIRRIFVCRLPLAVVFIYLTGFFLAGAVDAGRTALREHKSRPAYGSFAGWDNFVRGAGWLNDNASPTAVVMTADLRVVHFITGLKCIDLPTSVEVQKLGTYVQRWGVTHILLGAPQDWRAGRGRATKEAIGAGEIAARQVFSAGRCEVLELARASSASPVLAD